MTRRAPAGAWVRRVLLVLAVGLAPTSGCGRLGYDLLPERASGTLGGSPATNDASIDAPSAAGTAIRGAGGVSPVEASLGAGGTGGAHGGLDAGPVAHDAAMDAPPSARDAVADASRCPGPPSNVTDYCSAVPRLGAPPVIDGVLDCGLSLVPLVPVEWTGGATPPDASAEYAVAWRPDGVYFYVRVRDPSRVPPEPTRPTWEGDAVELFVDDDGRYTAPPSYDIPGSRQLVVAAPASSGSSVASAELWAFGNGGLSVKWTSSEFRAYGVSDGYVVEAFVTAPDLGLSNLALAEGGSVGMDLSIDVSYPAPLGPDAGTSGNRLGQYFLRSGELDGGTILLAPFDVRAFCRPTLIP